MRRLLAHLLFPAALLLLSACETQPDPMQVKVDAMDERLVRVERVVNNQSLVQLSQRIDDLDAQLRDLRGQVEELQKNDETLRKQQRDLYADLDRRLKALDQALHSGGGAGAGSSEAGSTAPTPSGGSAPQSGGDQAAYTRAFDALKSNDYPGAISQFQAFLKQYPQSALAGNAQYWLGEAYYVTHDYDNAISAFRAVGTQYPQSPKVPDALFEIGKTQLEQNKIEDARATFRQLVLHHSGTSAAQLASAQLQKMPAEAH